MNDDDLDLTKLLRPDPERLTAKRMMEIMEELKAGGVLDRNLPATPIEETPHDVRLAKEIDRLEQEVRAARVHREDLNRRWAVDRSARLGAEMKLNAAIKLLAELTHMSTTEVATQVDSCAAMIEKAKENVVESYKIRPKTIDMDIRGLHENALIIRGGAKSNPPSHF
jgi:hypothetical protein